MALQLDPEALYQRDGAAPVQQLNERLAEGAQDADTQALQAVLGGMVWTPSMRRMYTLLDRSAPST